MVAPITLNVRHIRGHTFTVEVDHDADTLGLKVVIWESQQIAVENQRLVFAGKELEEGTKLSDMGITDGAQIFLVESSDVSGDMDVSSQVANAIAVDVPVVPPAFAPESEAAAAAAAAHVQVVVPTAVAIPSQSGSFAVSMPAPNSPQYELVSDDQASLERINAAICLAKYVRVYCIFGFILSLLATLECMWSAIAVIIYLLGWIGTRKLNRCLLVFPMILTFLIGFGGMARLIYVAFAYCSDIDEYPYAWLIWAFAFFVCILHVMIFASIGKLKCRIKKLSCDEWVNARAKIRQRGCCC